MQTDWSAPNITQRLYSTCVTSKTCCAQNLIIAFLLNSDFYALQSQFKMLSHSTNFNLCWIDLRLSNLCCCCAFNLHFLTLISLIKATRNVNCFIAIHSIKPRHRLDTKNIISAITEIHDLTFTTPKHKLKEKKLNRWRNAAEREKNLSLWWFPVLDILQLYANGQRSYKKASW